MPKKILNGIVKKIGGKNFCVVRVCSFKEISIYRKKIRRSTLYHVGYSGIICNEGDRVLFEESRPVSRLIRWRVIKVLKAASGS
jgi:small subunit ribosomal protein S17